MDSLHMVEEHLIMPSCYLAMLPALMYSTPKLALRKQIFYLK